MPPRARRGSCAPGATDTDLLALFHELDTDASGCLSLSELGKALMTNREFARVCTGRHDDKPMSAIAAGLIAQNLKNIADAELGDCDGTISPEEFVLLCRRLMGEPAPPASSSGAGQQPSKLPAPSKPKGGGGLFGFGKGKPAPSSAREGRAEAKLYGMQTMLREDVVDELEALLARGSVAPDAESRATLYYEGLCAALVACKRLADTADDVGSRGESASAAEAEALELERHRRDLAGIKVALAEERAAREAAEHQLRNERLQANARKSRGWGS